MKKIFLLTLIFFFTFNSYSIYTRSKTSSTSQTSPKAVTDLKKQVDTQNYALERLENKFEKLKSDVEELKPKEKTAKK